MKKTYKRAFVVLGIGCILLLLLTYGWFVIGGLFPTGDDISKGDWLGFWGGYLSFTGATILGAVAVWQNNQANETNQRAIEENRKINEENFKNQLWKDQYLTIIAGIQSVSESIFSINKTIVNQLLCNHPNPDKDSLKDIQMIIDIVEQLITQIDFLYLKIDSIIPVYFDSEFPDVKGNRSKIKISLQNTRNSLEDYKNQLSHAIGNGNLNLSFNINIEIPQDALISMSSIFHKKLYSISSYLNDVVEGAKHEKHK